MNFQKYSKIIFLDNFLVKNCEKILVFNLTLSGRGKNFLWDFNQNYYQFKSELFSFIIAHGYQW